MTEKFKNLESMHTELKSEYEKLRATLSTLVKDDEYSALGNDTTIYRLLLMLHGEGAGRI